MPKNSTAGVDADFAREVETAVEGRHEHLEPPAWD